MQRITFFWWNELFAAAPDMFLCMELTQALLPGRAGSHRTQTLLLPTAGEGLRICLLW